MSPTTTGLKYCTISRLDSANYGQIRNLLNLVGIFVILPYPFEMFWYAGFEISPQHLQQKQMPLEAADVTVGSPAKFSMPVRLVLFFLVPSVGTLLVPSVKI